MLQVRASIQTNSTVHQSAGKLFHFLKIVAFHINNRTELSTKTTKRSTNFF